VVCKSQRFHFRKNARFRAFLSKVIKNSLKIRLFESKLCWNLHTFDFKKPIFVENESKAIGESKIPENLWKVIQSSKERYQWNII
jgi:hypothetical protein